MEKSYFCILWMGQDLFQLKPPKPPINASICCDIFWLARLRSSCNELKLTFLLSFSFFFSSCPPLVNNAASQCVFIFCSLRTANCLAEARKGQVEDLSGARVQDHACVCEAGHSRKTNRQFEISLCLSSAPPGYGRCAGCCVKDAFQVHQ